MKLSSGPLEQAPSLSPVLPCELVFKRSFQLCASYLLFSSKLTSCCAATLRILPCTGRMRHGPSIRSLSTTKVVHIRNQATESQNPEVDGSLAVDTAHQSKLGLRLVPIKIVGAYRAIVNHSSLQHPCQPRSTSLLPHAFGCTAPVGALRFQFSNSPVVKSCEPELPHLGAPQHGLEPKVDMLSTAVIRLYAHEVADLPRSRIFAQTAIAMEQTRGQDLRNFQCDEEDHATWNREEIRTSIAVAPLLKTFPPCVDSARSAARDGERIVDDVPLHP